MAEDREAGAEIIEAHQELVGRVERSAARIRSLSVVTILVALAFALLYVYQLLLPLTGTTKVTVTLNDPANVAVEVLTTVLALVWLYVGLDNLLFSRRVATQIRAARSKEREIEDKVSG